MIISYAEHTELSIFFYINWKLGLTPQTIVDDIQEPRSHHMCHIWQRKMLIICNFIQLCCVNQGEKIYAHTLRWEIE